MRSLGTGIAGLLASPLLGCAPQPRAGVTQEELGRLSARRTVPAESVGPGVHPLGLRPERDGVRYLPPQYRADTPIPLVLLLHGAGGSGARIAQRFGPYADELGIAFVAPDSTGVSWDRVDHLVSDVRFIDRALAWAFGRVNAAADRLAIAGFSDGASYSLSVGLTNGDLFGRILALSPGFLEPATTYGTPHIYVTHGRRDDILPIDITSRRIVSRLKTAGYDVEYHEFDGKHETPPEICRPAFAWLRDH